MAPQAGFTIHSLGDQAMTLSLGNAIDESLHRRIVAISQWINEHRFPGLADIVVTYSALTVSYDAYTLSTMCSPSPPSAFVHELLEAAYQHAGEGTTGTDPHVRNIPVCYAPLYAPDLEHICRERGLTPAEAIEIHTATVYRVYMIGFLPGFPYMAKVDPRLAFPRRSRPRPRIEAGSVGIAGVQTGIYPIASPGGWQIVGRTPLTLFKAAQKPPSLLRAGDLVKFQAISEEEFFTCTSNAI